MFKLLLLAIVANVYSVNSASDPELKLVSVVSLFFKISKKSTSNKPFFIGFPSWGANNLLVLSKGSP